MSQFEHSEHSEQFTPSENKRRSRLGLDKPKKSVVIEEPELSEEEQIEVLSEQEENEEQEARPKDTETDEDEKVEILDVEEKQPKKAELLKTKASRILFGVSVDDDEEKDEEKDEPEPQNNNQHMNIPELKKLMSEKNKSKKQSKKVETVNDTEEDEVIDEEEPKKTKSKKQSKPKGKYDEMTLKELQTLTKERQVVGRSTLKNREAIIAKLEELDLCPQIDEEPKPQSKYQNMTIPELKKLMGERNIAGRSTVKTKDAIVQKLEAFDANPEAEDEPVKSLGKREAQRHKKEKALEEPQDEEVNKKVAELVNKIYKMKKHAKKQGEDFKNGFMEYIDDLSKLVDDYQSSCN